MVRRVHSDPSGMCVALSLGHRAAQHVLHLQTFHCHLLRLRMGGEVALTAADPSWIPPLALPLLRAREEGGLNSHQGRPRKLQSNVETQMEVKAGRRITNALPLCPMFFWGGRLKHTQTFTLFFVQQHIGPDTPIFSYSIYFL